VSRLLISAVTGGNMFQAWNVGLLTERYFGVPGLVSGAVLALVVAGVIIGGIRRIGAVAGRLVPLMCASTCWRPSTSCCCAWATCPTCCG
jgi:alanine or glycine:cation symporter, AGCS family